MWGYDLSVSSPRIVGLKLRAPHGGLGVDLTFSILASDRWVETPIFGGEIEGEDILSVSSPRIVGLKPSEGQHQPGGRHGFQYPRLGSLG